MDKEQLYAFVAEATQKCNILVVGDVMLDKYYYGEVTRISPEAPVPITHVLSTKETLGGAANVAHNLALLGCQTSLAGFVGEAYHCQSLDALIISDYGKGACTQHDCQAIIRAAHAHGVPVIIDPKGTNWTKYEHADYITPNLKEINEVLLEPIRNKDEAVERAAHYVMRKYKIKNVIATRSEAGLSLVQDGKTTHIPTRAQEVFDVSGAGDTVIAVFAAGLAGGLSSAASAFLANLAASVVVAKLGTYAVSRPELLAALRALEE